MKRKFDSCHRDHIVVVFARRPIQLWRITCLRPISPRNLVGYGMNSSIGVRHEHRKLESQA